MRKNSSTECALRISLDAASAAGAETLLLSGKDIAVPHYDPDLPIDSPECARLVDALARCDGLIVASPAYHGTVSGLVKNAIDYTDQLRQRGRNYLDGVAIGLIVCSGGWQAGGQTLVTMRAIAHALRGWPTPFGVVMNTSISNFDGSGACVEPRSQAQLETVGKQVVQFAQMRMQWKTAESAVPLRR
jgi:FMN reductase